MGEIYRNPPKSARLGRIIVALIRLLKVNRVAPQTILLQFERPKKYRFEAGQYSYIELLEKRYPDYDHHRRVLSFASSPYDATIDFLVRWRKSGFKRELFELTPGDRVRLYDPIGSFSFTPNQTNICLIGGIGIAPIISLIRSAKSLPTVQIVWSNQTEIDTPWIPEARQALNTPRINLRLLVTRHPSPTPPLEPSRITAEWLSQNKLITPLATYLLCGSPSLVSDCSDMLTSVDIPLSQIKIEAFTGY